MGSLEISKSHRPFKDDLQDQPISKWDSACRWQECGGAESSRTAGGDITWYSLYREQRKLKMNIPYDSMIPILLIYPKETPLGIYSPVLMSMFTAAFFAAVKEKKSIILNGEQENE